MIPLALFFFLRIDLAACGLLWFGMNYRIVFLISVKKNGIGVLIEIALNLQMALDILIISSLPIHEHRAASFHLFVSLISFFNVL